MATLNRLEPTGPHTWLPRNKNERWVEKECKLHLPCLTLLNYNWHELFLTAELFDDVVSKKKNAEVKLPWLDRSDLTRPHLCARGQMQCHSLPAPDVLKKSIRLSFLSHCVLDSSMSHAQRTLLSTTTASLPLVRARAKVTFPALYSRRHFFRHKMKSCKVNKSFTSKINWCCFASFFYVVLNLYEQIQYL